MFWLGMMTGFGLAWMLGVWLWIWHGDTMEELERYWD